MLNHLNYLVSLGERFLTGRCFGFLAVFAVISKKRIAVSGLKLDEKSFGHGPRAPKCLLFLKSVNDAKIGPRIPVFLPVFCRCKQK